MCFRDKGFENELPKAYLGRKLSIHRRINPLPQCPTNADHAREVAMLWEHVPNAWNAHVSSNDAATTHQLWKLVKDRHKALLASTASKTSDIAKLIQTEVNRQLFIRDKYKNQSGSKH
jgi:hypothetical protein